jgi:hypothetical protein
MEFVFLAKTADNQLIDSICPLMFTQLLGWMDERSAIDHEREPMDHLSFFPSFLLSCFCLVWFFHIKWCLIGIPPINCSWRSHSLILIVDSRKSEPETIV